MTAWRNIKFAPCLALALAVASPCYAQVTANPDWLHRPSPQDIQAAFPSAAAAHGVSRGRVVVACKVIEDGKLDCAVQNEDPPGLGFGAAALALSAQYQMKTRTADGHSMIGATLAMPITFVSPATRP